MPRYIAAIPNTNVGLRTHVANLVNLGTTNIGLRAVSNTTYWYNQIDIGAPYGVIWNESVQGTNNVTMGFLRGCTVAPIFTFVPGSTVIQDDPYVLGTVFNYGWGAGETISGFNSYGTQILNSFVSKTLGPNDTAAATVFMNANLYNIRQVLYNSNRGQIALRISYDGGAPVPQQTGVKLNMVGYNSASVTSWAQSYSSSEANLIYFNRFLVGTDYTAVWVWSGASALPTGTESLTAVSLRSNDAKAI